MRVPAKVRFRRFREGEGWSKAEFARRLRCSPDMVRHIETGLRRPGRGLANAISEHTRGSPVGEIKSEDWDDDGTAGTSVGDDDIVAEGA